MVLLYTFLAQRTPEMLRLDQQIKLGMRMINQLRFMTVDSLEYLVVADEVPTASRQRQNTVKASVVLLSRASPSVWQ